MADACVGDDQGNLIFLSIWARDTAVQQFLARLTLRRDEQGLDQFHLITDQGGSVPVFVGNVDRLEKRMTRAIGERCSVRCPTCGCSIGAASSPTRPTPAHWHLLPATAPPARPPVDVGAGTPAHCRCSTTGANRAGTAAKPRMLTRLPFALGPLEGHRLAIDVPALTLGARLADPQ